jgi:hypothetical protein
MDLCPQGPTQAHHRVGAHQLVGEGKKGTCNMPALCWTLGEDSIKIHGVPHSRDLYTNEETKCTRDLQICFNPLAVLSLLF